MDPSQSPLIANPNNLLLPPLITEILQQMFESTRQLVVEAEFSSGFSSSRVFLVKPDEPALPAVVKLAPIELVKQEWKAYQTHIHEKVPGVAEIRGVPVPSSDSTWGGLRYQLVGEGVFEVGSLLNFCRQANLTDIWHVLENRLFKQLEAIWQLNTLHPEFDFQASYDAVLPVNMVIRPAVLPPDEVQYSLYADTIGTKIAKTGDRVSLAGFVITEVDHKNKSLTLNTPLSSASYRVRLQPVEGIQHHQINETLKPMTGVVTDTRQDILLAQVQSIVGRELDLTADAILLPGQSGLVLPNPLRILPKLLHKKRKANVATIHGDLHLDNG